jgi:hypothetical protein
LGNTVRTIDLTAYAFLANILKYEGNATLRSFVRRKPNLVEFVDRVEKRISEGKKARAA